MWAKAKNGKYINLKNVHAIEITREDDKTILSVYVADDRSSLFARYAIEEEEAQRIIDYIEAERAVIILSVDKNDKNNGHKMITDKQKGYLQGLLKRKKLDTEWVKEKTGKAIDELTSEEASNLITELSQK